MDVIAQTLFSLSVFSYKGTKIESSNKRRITSQKVGEKTINKINLQKFLLRFYSLYA
jgi:hypothetical protein